MSTAQWGPLAADRHSLYFRRYGADSEVHPVLYTVPQHAPPTRYEGDALAYKWEKEDAVARAASHGWTESDTEQRVTRLNDLALRVRGLQAQTYHDRVRTWERSDADALALRGAMAANAMAPPRQRDDLVAFAYAAP
eukprot:TRINITY_DN56301_c0_g1_i1.p2 TRINITY_DN56301_c0_g1~~TRINITY_DN56301_c0_g1_i1.p2  ORF type:complete len:137 (+),score=42.05 TRINITY_DN56301_c0_g1_i1:82-492(+)